MKGLIFTELLDFVDRNTSVRVTETIIRDAELSNEGAFTSVGNYPHSEAVKLVESAARILDVPATELMQQFGRELFVALRNSHQQFFTNEAEDAFSLLAKIQDHIHSEVAKLYPDSSPPQVKTSTEDGVMTVHYDSHRPFAMIAMGLIEGCCAYFDDSLIVELHGDSDKLTSHAIFTVARKSTV